VLLGKALQDPIKGVSALARVGVTLTEQQKKQAAAMAKSGDTLGAQKIILKAVEKQVKGTAAATATGGDKMTVAMGEFQESVGGMLLPIVEKLLPKLSGLFDLMAKHPKTVMAIVGAVALLAGGILALNVAMGIYTAVTTLAASATLAAWVAAAWPILAVVAAVALVVIGIRLLWKHSETFRSIVLAVWGAVKAAAAATANFLRTAFVAVWRVLAAGGRAFGSAVRAVFNAFRAVASAVAGVVRRVVQVAFAGASAYVRAWQAIAKGAFSAIRSAAGWVVDKVRAIGAALRGLKVPGFIKTALDAIKNAAGLVIGKIRDLASKLSGLRMPGAVVSAAQTLKSAVEGVLGAVRDLAGALSNLHVPHLSFPKIPKIFSRAVTPAGAFTTPRVRTANQGRAAAGPAPVVINVSGALDPEAVARQLRRILSGHDRRVGLRVG
jgi:phage-related protein